MSNVSRWMVRCGGEEWEVDLMSPPHAADQLMARLKDGELTTVHVIFRTVFEKGASPSTSMAREGILHCVPIDG